MRTVCCQIPTVSPAKTTWIRSREGLPLGIGRFYIGDTGIGIAQLLVTIFTCGIGALWPFIDGIIMLVTDSKDAQGRMLRT